MNLIAENLNKIIKEENSSIYSMLSKKGKEIFFPTKGILAQAADAKNKDINATIGAAIEDDNTPMVLDVLDSLVDLSKEEVFPYAPSFGLPQLRAKWKEMLEEKNVSLKDSIISTPVVTNALTHGLSMVGYLFIDSGDEVIMPDLYWGNYNLVFKNEYGANFNTFPLFNNNSCFNVEGLKKSLNSSSTNKKIIVLNFPNNPTGYSPTKNEVNEIVDVLKSEAEKGSNLLVVCDDAYFGLNYEDEICDESIFAKLFGLHENILAVKVDGPTKEDYVWGFRIGFVTFGVKNGNENLYSALEQKLGGAIRGNISNASRLSQALLLKAYENDRYLEQKKEKYNILKSRYLEVKSVLESGSYNNFTPLPYNSGYFMCVKLNDGIDGEAVRKCLLDKYSTGIINTNNIFRVAFSSVSKDKIKLLFDNIENAINDINKI